MPARQFACPKCKTKLSAPEGAAKFRCPKCKTVLTAPGQPSAQPLRPAEPEEELVGQSLGGYQVTRFLGSGGMGSVYEALQEGLRRRVAIKVIPGRAAQDPGFLTSFKREAQAAAKLNHPNIIQIFDIIEDKGFHFFSMEFVEGENLADRLAREGRLPVADALDILAQVAQALDHAYEHMLVHRDLKPSNVLISSRGEVKVADLGLSKSLEETSVGVVRGTHGGPVYMAPEFARNPQLADCRSDIYALGCVLFHLVTGRPPFPGPSLADLLNQHASTPLPSAKALVPELPEAADALLQRMCAKDPAGRFQTYGELVGQLNLLLKATAVRMPRRPVARQPKPVLRRAGRRWLFLILASIAAAVVVACVLLLLRSRGSARARAAVPPPTETSVSKGPDQKAAPPPPTPPDLPKLPVLPKPPEEKKAPELPKPPDVKEKEVPKPPEPKKEEPPKDEKKEEPPKEEEKPKEGEKAPEPGAPEAKLAEVKKATEALVKERQFGKAIAALEALAKDADNAEVKKAVEEATAAIRKQAAEAYAAVREGASGLAAQGKLAEAKAALQAVVDQFGTKDEVDLAKASLGALGQHEQAFGTIAKAAEKAAAEADAAEQRAARQAELAKALAPVAELVSKWDFTAAAARLAEVKAGDPAQLEPRKAALDGLVALRARMIKTIKEAKPRLRKGDLRIVGINGDLTDADASGLTAEIPGKTEKLPWAGLRDVSVEALVNRAADPKSAAHQLGAALLLSVIGSAEKAKAHLDKAEALGAKTEGAIDLGKADERAEREAKAARAFADALKLLAAGQYEPAKAALDDYRKAYAESQQFAASKEALQLAAAFRPLVLPSPSAQEEPKPPGPKPPDKTPQPPKPPTEPEAVKLWEKAAAALAVRRFADCKAALDQINAKFPNSPLLTDNQRKPTVDALRQAVEERGETLKVSRTADGARKTLQDAINALKKPNATIEIEPGTYRGGVTITGQNAQGLVLRGVGDARPVLDGGPAKKTVLNFPADCKDVWIEHLELAGADPAIFVGARCSVTLRDCLVLEKAGRALSKEADGRVALARSLLNMDTLAGTDAEACAFRCADEALFDNANFTGCVLTGSDLQLRNARLTDCLILGSVTLAAGTKLLHVTIIGPVTVPPGNRDIAITDSILELLDVQPDPKDDKKKQPPVAVTLKSVLICQSARPFPKGLVKEEEVLREKVRFLDPKAGDWQLTKESPYRGKASDGGDLGCRFPPAMLDLLGQAKHHASLLRPPAGGKRHSR